MMDPVKLRAAVSEIESSDYQPTKWERDFLRGMKDLVTRGKFTRGAHDYYLEEILIKARNPDMRKQVFSGRFKGYADARQNAYLLR